MIKLRVFLQILRYRFVAVSYDTAQAFSLLISIMWLYLLSVFFLNVSMLFSPCLKIFGTKNFAVADGSVCHVIPSFSISPIVAVSPSAIFCVSWFAFPKRRIFVVNCERIDWGRRWLTGPGSLKSKDTQWPTFHDYLSHVRQELRLLLLSITLTRPWELHQSQALSAKPHSEAFKPVLFIACSFIGFCLSLVKACY